MGNYTHKIILFSEENFKGVGLVIFNDIDLADSLPLWKNRAKSLIVIKGGWVLRSAEDNYPEESVGEYVHSAASYPSFSFRWKNRVSALQTVNSVMKSLVLENEPMPPQSPRVRR